MDRMREREKEREKERETERERERDKQQFEKVKSTRKFKSFVLLSRTFGLNNLASWYISFNAIICL